MASSVPKCALTRNPIPAGEELWRIRLDREAADWISKHPLVNRPGKVEPGMYHVCHQVAEAFREYVAEQRGLSLEKVGMRDLA